MAIPQGPRADPTPFAFGGGQSESGGLFGGAGFGDDKFARLLMGLALLDSGRPRVNPPSAMETIAPLVQMLGQQSSQKNAMNFMNKAFEPGAPNAAGLLGAGESASPDIPAGIQMPEQAPSAAPPVSGQMMTGGGIDDAAAQKMAGQYWPAVKAAAEQNGIPAGILAKQIAQESSFNPNAKSSAGALGISQFMPGTARRFGIDPLDPNQAIPAGAQYVAKNTATFGGNLGLGLAGYNWGEGNVQKWLARGANPSAMPAETRKYVANITGKPIDAWVNGGGSDTPAATLIPTQAQGRVTPIPTQGTARVQYAQATPQTMTDASSGASQPADAPPTPVQSPRAAVGQAFAAGELPDVSTRQLQQAQAAMPNTVAPRSPETVTGSRTQAAYAMKMFDHWGRVAAGAGMLGTGGAGLIEYAKAQMGLAAKFIEPTELDKNISKLPKELQGRAWVSNLMPNDPEQQGKIEAAKRSAGLPYIGPETAAKTGAERAITEPSDIRIATAKENLGRESTRQQQLGAASLEPTTIFTRQPDGSMVERQVTRKQYAEMVGSGDAAPATAGGAAQPGGALTPGSAVFGKPYQTPGEISGSETRAKNEENQIPVFQKEGEAARNDIALLKSMKDAAGNIHQGLLAGPTQSVAKLMRMVDPSFDKQVAGYEELTKNSGTFVRNAVRGTDSNPSTQMFSMIQASLPQPETSPLGFRRVTDQMLGLAQYKAAKAQALPAYEAANKGSHAGYESWFYKNVTPYAFMVSAMHPDDRKELYMRLQTSDQGKRELQMLRPQLEFIHQQGLDR